MDPKLSMVSSIPAILLSFEFLIGGIGRLSSFPFPKLHKHIYEKSRQTTPTLYPVVPFRDVARHLKWVGTGMTTTGILLAYPSTRGNLLVLGLVYFWTGAGWYSQRKTRMPYWLPITNALLGTLVWYVEQLKEKARAP